MLCNRENSGSSRLQCVKVQKDEAVQLQDSLRAAQSYGIKQIMDDHREKKSLYANKRVDKYVDRISVVCY